jgi:hypothetical protein
MPAISPEQVQLRALILELLEHRGPGKTICPSDAAELVASGEIEVSQRGEVVDMAQARGPIRLRRRPSEARPGPSADRS